MAPTEAPSIDLESLVLAKGAHRSPTEGACVMEAFAFVAGEPWSDHPECASRVLGAFLRSWNDTLPDDERQQLKQYVPRLVGSKGTAEQEDARAWLAMDWLVRSYTPTWLRFAASTAPQYAEGLAAHADRLAALPEFRAGMDVPSIRPAIASATAPVTTTEPCRATRRPRSASPSATTGSSSPKCRRRSTT